MALVMAFAMAPFLTQYNYKKDGGGMGVGKVATQFQNSHNSFFEASFRFNFDGFCFQFWVDLGRIFGPKPKLKIHFWVAFRRYYFQVRFSSDFESTGQLSDKLSIAVSSGPSGDCYWTTPSVDDVCRMMVVSMALPDTTEAW